MFVKIVSAFDCWILFFKFVTWKAQSNTGASCKNLCRCVLLAVSYNRTVQSHEVTNKNWLEFGANLQDEITSPGALCNCTSFFLSILFVGVIRKGWMFKLGFILLRNYFKSEQKSVNALKRVSVCWIYRHLWKWCLIGGKLQWARSMLALDVNILLWANEKSQQMHSNCSHFMCDFSFWLMRILIIIDNLQ